MINQQLRALLLESKRQHYRCDDAWYSCPMDEEGCSDTSKEKECDCGADDWNAKVDAALALPDEPTVEPANPAYPPPPKDGPAPDIRRYEPPAERHRGDEIEPKRAQQAWYHVGQLAITEPDLPVQQAVQRVYVLCSRENRSGES